MREHPLSTKQSAVLQAEQKENSNNLNSDKTIMENSLTATRDAITQNNTKLTNVTKAKAGSAKDSGKIDTSLKG